MNRKKIRFATGISVFENQFDKNNGIVLASHPLASDYNMIISNTKARINDIFVRYRLQFRELTPKQLRKEFKIKSSFIDFHIFLSKTIEERVGEISYSSIKQHRVLAKKLKEYSPTLYFSDIDDEFMSKFNRWMIHKKKNSVNTRFNAFKNFKAYLNIAKRKQIIDINPLENYMPVGRVLTERLFLLEDQLRSLQELYARNYLSETDNKILRHFLFMCFTGLRISDLKTIQMNDISRDMLVFTAYKTRETKPAPVKVPLCNYAKQLIKDESPHRLHGPVFNCFAEQTMRTRIKEIVKVVKIDMDISLHTARHTFATLFLRKTKNIAALQKLLGHTKIEMTLVYAHILTDDIENEIHNAFDSF